MRRILVSIAAVTSLVAAGGNALAAQPTTALAPGARLRLITPRLEASQQLVQIISATRDSVSFRSEAYPVTRTIALSEVAAIEVRSEGQRPFLRNMVVGAGLGAVLGGVIASASYEECTDCWFWDTSRGEEALAGAILGAGAGVLLGIGVAAVMPGERWTRIPLNANVALRPTRGGRFAVTLARSF